MRATTRDLKIPAIFLNIKSRKCLEGIFMQNVPQFIFEISIKHSKKRALRAKMFVFFLKFSESACFLFKEEFYF